MSRLKVTFAPGIYALSVRNDKQSPMPTVEEILEERPPEFYRLLAECIEIAEHRGTIYYEDVAEIVDTIPVDTGAWAGAVSEELVANANHDYPMLSAVIVGKGDDTPGDSFYEFASELGRLSDDPDSMSEAE